jgi:phytoene desaturase
MRDQGDGATARPRAVVIGSGFGGLAAAVRLLAKGWAVTVCERLDAPGGRAYTFRQDGFVFDAGPTIITAPYLFEELWQLAGRRLADDVELRSIDPFYTIRFDDGVEIACSGDRDLMRAEVARIEPADADGYDRFLAASAAIYKAAFVDLAAEPFHDLRTLLKSVPDLMRHGAYASVYTKVARYFRNEHLRVAFSFHPLLIGGNPFNTTSYYCLISHLERLHGVHYAIGGTGALVSGLVGLIERMGGTIRYGADVRRILVENGRAAGVELAGGERLPADVVVSNADPAWTYGKLLADHPRRVWTDRKIAAGHYSMSLFVWYFGTNRRFEDVPHHTMILGPRYRELLDDIFHNHVLADDFSLYLHRPTASDPSLAPDGCDAFYVLAPVPNLRSRTDWPTIAESYRARIQKRLEETALPGLGEALVTSRLITPQDFQDRLCSVNGAAFALEPRLFQSAWFRPHNKSQDLKGLYLVGAGTHPGAGVPGVLSSAKVVDALVPAAAAFRRVTG